MIIGGDFNINIEKDQIMINNFFSQTKLNFCLPIDHPSTDYNTQIDLCFSNIKLKSNYYESLLSDHKPFWIILNSDVSFFKLYLNFQIYNFFYI